MKKSHELMELLNVKYDNIALNTAIEKIVSLVKKQNEADVFFLNADCLYKAQKDEEYRNILNSADLVLPDGIGLKIMTRIFGKEMKEDCNGTDFSPLLMRKLTEKGYKIFFLGSREGVAEKAAENMRKQISMIQILGTHSGYFNNDEEVIKKINVSGADVLFVAMGVPLQEKWIARNRGKLNPRLCLGVGALLDYLSGTIPRAPLFMRKMHIEWLWRIFIEPKRMFRRYIIDGAKLFWIVLKHRFTAQPSSLK
jgi:N-acetylglucosaminyldiphosphoundecaprenol N-acetyl-beta-D-mannosaminyltransferase